MDQKRSKGEAISSKAYDYPDLEVNSTNSDPPEISKLQFSIILIGIFFGVFVSGVDETILSTAQESIIKEFNASSDSTWIATSYLMAMVVFTPLYGKFCDIFGRKVCMLFALVTFSIGSLGCALAVNIIMLVVFRAIAGIGGGGIVSVSYVIISDLVSLEERGTFLGLVSISFAISNMLGPILGGLIVENMSWRFVFYVNLPIAGALILIVLFVIPLPWVEGTIISKLKRVDYLGVLTLSATIILFVLGTTWGGNQYSWTSYQVLTVLCFSAISLGAFAIVEYKFAVEPVLPPKMFNINVSICSLINMILGLVDFTIIYYLPIYYQILQGMSSSQSGYELAPFLVISSSVAMLSGIFANKLGSFRIPIWIGSVFMTIGSGLLCLSSPNLPSWAMTIFSCILSFGIGCSLQMTAIGAQASAEPEYIAIVAGFFNFTLNFGGTLGLAIDGAILYDYFSDIKELVDFGIDDHSLIPEIETNAYYATLKVIFYFLLTSSLIATISSLFLKHKSLKNVKITAGH
ncbi:MFS general substrate transporter [Conidiobolus coronatus NRRL 28638]|uniref:MFS general substrate transporter n=1 Tax=Conidiobolus coronatus (strain ATCC 28846 / CBS 209.66 / NRRL 28638) TaxID=796925 RepID=A0A137P8D9_CONC2|nr:MFS general substrate transporter [Conidiobolus coronatus NRRL 28638]|eukprot:KXN71277.1 MFS general substrate transporter [Conidiobolus coronatus NRRL 28638]